MRRAGLQADERVKAAVQSHQENGRQLEQEAAELLEQAGEAQKVGLLGAPRWASSLPSAVSPIGGRRLRLGPGFGSNWADSFLKFEM